MKSAFFKLTNPEYSSETDEHGFYRCWARFRVPVLPAYAILNYTIQGVTSRYNGLTGELDGAVDAIESGIVDDVVILYGIDDLTQRLMPTDPTLVINYLGIRDYQKFFPHFENQLLRERAAQFLEEADKTFEEASWLAFAMMAGAVFESLLFDIVGDTRVGFGSLINKIKAAKVFEEMELAALQIACDARNLIHAGRYGDVYITREKAMRVRVVLEQFLRNDWGKIKEKYVSLNSSNKEKK